MSTFTMKQATHSGPDAVSGQVIGELINLGRRQRMLSQRIVLHVLLASLGNSDALSVAKACLGTFAQAHTDLVSGYEGLPGVFSEALRELYFGNRRADERIQQFIAQVNRAVSCVESGRAEDRTQVEAFVIQATPLLELLQDITLAYQHEMRGTEAPALKRQTDIAERLGSISMQANLVALNARISAARAGQFGREFAVITAVLADIIKEMDELIKSVVDTRGMPLQGRHASAGRALQ
jgi:hypothetical protein